MVFAGTNVGDKMALTLERRDDCDGCDDSLDSGASIESIVTIVTTVTGKV